MDALQMEFQDDIFTHCIDKSCLDSILVNSKINKSGYRSIENCRSLLSEVKRVLKPGGVYICISYHDDLKEKFLDNGEDDYDWNIEIHKIYKPTLENELKLIKNEHVSDEVLEYIESKKKVTYVPNKEDSPNTSDKKKLRFDEIAEPLVIESEVPPDLQCHYAYICSLRKEVEVAEEEVDRFFDGEEELGEEENSRGVNDSEESGLNGTRSYSKENSSFI